MDLSAEREALERGKRATVPKHGKKPENRLYSKWRRGNPAKEGEGDGSINPDASIRVAAVCGSQVRIYDKSKRVRRLSYVMEFSSHGEALNYAADHDEQERRFRTNAKGESDRVIAPFYQVKVAGHVIDQTNSRERAHAELRAGSAKPKELWLVNEGGSADLLDAVTA